ncbi:MAG: thiamine-phosphate synthase family protein [Candidatus Hodarchaeales archaeon]|jgi:predicted fused transcriptional regulator/phosphomethylpyrimidine kinase/predicted transcriptional regulator
MHFICEIVPPSFLTPLRRALAQELARAGFIQMEIAQVLGVSQPVVSSYLKAPISQPSQVTSRPAFEELISDLVQRIKNKPTSLIDLMGIICQECQQFRTAGPLCDVHRKKTTLDFPPDCNICFPSPELTEVFNQRLQMTRELFEAGQKLVDTGEKFGKLIPEIGCQFVSLAENSKTLEDIAGFPGRIVKVKGKGKMISSPEFSQGSTLAQILIYFRKHGSAHRSLISLRNTEEIVKTITSGKFIVRTEEADKNWDETLEKIPDEEIRKVEVITDAGGIGLEAILYLFGRTPSEIAEFIISGF